MIEGVGDTDAHEGGPVALLIKVHHAAVDGVSAANLLTQLCSPEPDSAPPDPVEGPGDATGLDIAAGGLVKFISRPLDLAKAVPATLSTIVNTVSRARSGTAMAAPFNAPTTPFNAEITAERNIAMAQLDFEDVKRVKNRFGVKVNDVVLALCAGALREFLRGRGELPDKPLVAVVPMSVHDTSDRPGRNQVSGCSATSRPTSRIRVNGCRPSPRRTPVQRSTVAAIAPSLVLDLTQVITRAMFGFLLGVAGHTPLTHTAIHNVIISNVAGPPNKLYFLGAEIKALYPLGPIFHGSGLNITVMSLSGKLNVGIISCQQLVADLSGLADGFEPALAELLGCRKP